MLYQKEGTAVCIGGASSAMFQGAPTDFAWDADDAVDVVVYRRLQAPQIEVRHGTVTVFRSTLAQATFWSFRRTFFHAEGYKRI